MQMPDLESGSSMLEPAMDPADSSAPLVDPSDLKDPSLYLNRELELLDFQERVLEEAEDSRNPLLERVKFLSIFSSNMAEFYMVRVAGLKQQVQAGVNELSADGLTPGEQLVLVREQAKALLRRARSLYHELHAELDAAGIHVLDYADLDEHQRTAADEYFESNVLPVLTPLAFDPGRPFPHISNQSFNLALLVRTSAGEERFARVKLPRTLPRLVPLCPPAGAGPVCETRAQGSGGRAYHYVWLDQLVTAHLGTLFPGLEVVEAHPFRVTRDAEMEIQELEADDLLETIEEGVRKRRFGSIVRVTVVPSLPAVVRDILIENLEADPADITTIEPPIGATDLMELYRADRPDLKDPPWVPVVPPSLADAEQTDLFAAIRERDILLHRPFESFEPFVRLLQQAAEDPDVLAIKTTLYRVGRDSPVVEALLEAAQNHKEVAALVELKARFDEESNIGWAKRLEAEGVHVVYGLLGLKTHSKIALIVRKEADGLRRYVHVGTGNYNVVTATQYTDLDLLTCDPQFGSDATTLFNYLTGYAEESSYDRFLVAPLTLRPKFEELIRREIEHARNGAGGHLVFKMNSLVDLRMVRLLYEASQAGVRVELIVRGICILRPGISGLSENITVRSILGRFLEHSRIYWFGNAGEPECLIGSADLMRRNLDRRVEILAPVLDASIKARLRDILDTYLADTEKARLMRHDGSYVRAEPAAGQASLQAQQALMDAAAAMRARG